MKHFSYFITSFAQSYFPNQTMLSESMDSLMEFAKFDEASAQIPYIWNKIHYKFHLNCTDHKNIDD